MSKPVAGEGVTRPAVVQKSRAVRLTLIVAACCMVGLACAPRAIADETLIKKKFTHHAAVRGKAVAPVITEPDPAMLEPAAAPDCAFGGTMSNPATVEQTRAKLDYEAQCYRQAEAIVRERLGQMHDAAKKMIRAIRQRNLVISSR